MIKKKKIKKKNKTKNILESHKYRYIYYVINFKEKHVFFHYNINHLNV